jgi:uncharacterized protein (DUF697 family)
MTDPAAPPANPPNPPDDPLGRAGLLSAAAVVGCGAIGGILYWILCRWTSTPLPASFGPIGTFLAVIFVAALCGAFGVYLLTASDLKSMRTYIFAIACGLLWQSVLSSVKTFVGNATGSTVAATVKTQSERLGQTATTSSSTVAPEIQNTQSTILQGLSVLASATDASTKSDLAQAVDHAIGNLGLAGTKDPTTSIGALQQVAIQAANSGQTAPALRAIDTVKAIGTQAAQSSQPEVRQQAVNALTNIADNTNYSAKTQALSGAKAIPPSASPQAQAPALKLQKISGDGQTIPLSNWGEFAVEVTDQNGSPVANQKVVWQTPAGGLNVYVCETNAQGTCSAKNVYAFSTAGQYVQLATLAAPNTPVGFSTVDQVTSIGPSVSFQYKQGS